MEQPTTYPVMVKVRMPAEVAAAVEQGARDKFLTRSEYVRQAVLQTLKADGVDLTAERNNIAEMEA